MATPAVQAEPKVLRDADCVLRAAADTFASTCGIDVASSGPAGAGGVGRGAELIAVISLVGDVEWTLWLALPRATAEAVAGRFAGFEIPFDSPDMGDAVGELANILAGRTKAELDARGIHAEISLPTVMRGSPVSVLGAQHVLSASWLFSSPCGLFAVAVAARM